MKKASKQTRMIAVGAVAAVVLVVTAAAVSMRFTLGNEPLIVPPAMPPPPPPSTENSSPDRGPGYEMMKQNANKLILSYDKSPSMLAKTLTYVMPRSYDTLYFVFEDALLKMARSIRVEWEQGFGNRKSILIRPRQLRSQKYCHTKIRHRNGVEIERIDLGQMIGIPMYSFRGENDPKFLLAITCNPITFLASVAPDFSNSITSSIASGMFFVQDASGPIFQSTTVLGRQSTTTFLCGPKNTSLNVPF